MEEFPQRIEAGGVVLDLSPQELYVQFEKEDKLAFGEWDSTRQELEDLGLYQIGEEEQPVREAGLSLSSTSVGSAHLGFSAKSNVEDIAARTLAISAVRTASPVFHRPDLPHRKTALSFSDALLVRTRPDVSQQALTDLWAEHGLEDVTGDLELLGGTLRRVRVAGAGGSDAPADQPKPTPHQILVTAVRLKDSPLVAEAYPDWIELTSPFAEAPNDPYYRLQWDMRRIACPAGWDITTGDSSVIIAVLDTGVDLSHPDLREKLVPEKEMFSVDGALPIDFDGHGTCCAGLAAGGSNNGVGTTGVAWGCRIMPIRIMCPTQNGARIPSEVDLVAGLEWARAHGALVASMSWTWTGGRNSFDAAVARAYELGMVLVAASGNGDVRTLEYPARHPRVMAVGATNRRDQRKSSRDSDKESWGSQYGPGLSVVAPGVACWTTDVTAGAGYNINGGPMQWSGVSYESSGSEDGGYFALMNGTSAATPHVAGLAALIRSLRPDLRNDQVSTIIERTADKVGGYPYVMDWHQEMGYGRINVFRALRLAQRF